MLVPSQSALRSPSPGQPPGEGRPALPGLSLAVAPAVGPEVLPHPGGAAQLIGTASQLVRPWLKRTADVVLSLLALLLLAPVLLGVAVAIKIDSPGPVFFRVRRVGFRGKEFRMLKFRKMHHDAAGAPLTTHVDPRLTRIGMFLTRTRIDELPQLWEVLRGRMSLVGPRPEDPGFVVLHRREYAQINQVRPGLAGLSQLAYAAEQRILREDDPVQDYITRVLPQKLRLDTLYATRWTLRMDISILFWTLATVLLGKPVAVNRRTGSLNVRRRQEPPPAAG